MMFPAVLPGPSTPAKAPGHSFLPTTHPKAPSLPGGHSVAWPVVHVSKTTEGCPTCAEITPSWRTKVDTVHVDRDVHPRLQNWEAPISIGEVMGQDYIFQVLKPHLREAGGLGLKKTKKQTGVKS